jgi:hypothetical protein
VAIGAVLGAFSVMVLPPLLARPLLGIQAGPLRIALSGFVGISVSGSLIGPQFQAQGPRIEMLTLMVGVGMLAAMVTLVAMDVAVPPGGLRPLSWASRLRARPARVRRYSQIVRIAGRHGLGPYLSGRGRPHGDPPRTARAGAAPGSPGGRHHLREARAADVDPARSAARSVHRGAQPPPGPGAPGPLGRGGGRAAGRPRRPAPGGVRRVRRLDRIGSALEEGRLGVSVRLLADPRDWRSPVSCSAASCWRSSASSSV